MSLIRLETSQMSLRILWDVAIFEKIEKLEKSKKSRNEKKLKMEKNEKKSETRNF